MSEPKLRVLHVIVQAVCVLDDGHELRPAPKQMQPVKVALSELPGVAAEIAEAVGIDAPGTGGTETESAPKSPWLEFLRVRALVIDELHAEGKDDTEIAEALSMDRGQVHAIRTGAE